MNITTKLLKVSSHHSALTARAVYAARYYHGPEKAADLMGQLLSTLSGTRCADARGIQTAGDMFSLDAYQSGIIYGKNYLIGQADDITDVYFIVDSTKKSN